MALLKNYQCKSVIQAVRNTSKKLETWYVVILTDSNMFPNIGGESVMGHNSLAR